MEEKGSANYQKRHIMVQSNRRIIVFFITLLGACAGSALCLYLLSSSQSVRAASADRLPTTVSLMQSDSQLVPLDICSTPLGLTPGSAQTLTVTFNGLDRPVSFYMPSSYQPTQTVPLLFALHGGSGDSSQWLEPERKVTETAEAAGWIVVMPNGLPKPSAPPSSTNYFWGDPINQEYMIHLMDCMVQQFTIDESRIYFIGFSGGAKLIYNLAERADSSARIAAIATAAGEWGVKQTERLTVAWEMIDPSLRGGIPMSALLLQGGRDDRLPAEGGFGQSEDQPVPDKIAPSFQTKVDAWRLFVSATTSQSITLTHAPARLVSTLHANRATGNVVVAAYDPVLGHKWPDWNYMGAIWDFFQQVPTRTRSRSAQRMMMDRQPASQPMEQSPINMPRAMQPIGTFSVTPGIVQTFTVNYSGTQRNVSIYVPLAYTGTAVPLLFALHGGGQDASAMFEPSKEITRAAEEHKFIAIFPNGLPRPTAPPTSTNYFWPVGQDATNIGFINQLMNLAIDNFAIDPCRIYVIGFSMGANMTLRLAADAETSQRIAAVATMAGVIGLKYTTVPTSTWWNIDPLVNQASPGSALLLQGAHDTTHPTNGGFDSDFG
jgi:poly(3-hydroxybutyrate) depolymerase